VLDLDAVFDPDKTRRPSRLRLLRELWSLLTYRPTPPPPGELPDGGGRAVLVVPAFMTGDSVTLGLRRFLASCGFHAFGWELGTNRGPTPELLDGLAARVAALRAAHGKVALVGISLGGVLARHLAQERAGDVCHVVTVASPFLMPISTWVEPLVRRCGPWYTREIDVARLGARLAVPETAIFTHDDGIVSPANCWVAREGLEVVALRGAHVTLASNPVALRAIVRRLAPAAR
jgi:pimeloyl-ACP methyl ester carboxylesterase